MHATVTGVPRGNRPRRNQYLLRAQLIANIVLRAVFWQHYPARRRLNKTLEPICTSMRKLGHTRPRNAAPPPFREVEAARKRARVRIRIRNEGELVNPRRQDLGSTNQNAIAKTMYPVGLCHTIPGAKLCSVPCISVALRDGLEGEIPNSKVGKFILLGPPTRTPTEAGLLTAA